MAQIGDELLEARSDMAEINFLMALIVHDER
jgi:hypothetical protein